MVVGLAAFVFASGSALPLQPSSRWNIEYADKMCILQRRFGTGEEAVTLAFRPAPVSEQMQIVILRPRSGKQRTDGTALLRFDGGKSIQLPFLESDLQSGRALFLDAERAKLAPLATAKTVEIKAGATELYLAPTMVDAGMKALEACEQDLLVQWGMDPQVVETIATYPKTERPPLSYFRGDDYPHTAIRDEEQGLSGVRYLVGVDGRPTNCQIVETSGSPELDKTTCDVVVDRFRFKPALTRQGAAVPCIGYTRVRWEVSRYGYSRIAGS